MAERAKVRICLAASSGGHLRQLLDLRPLWQAHDSHFITEPTPLAKSLAEEHRVHLAPHFALGQIRTSSLWSALRAGLSNVRASWQAIRAERPQLVISTGAGSIFFAVLFAKLRGARFIFIESFARFEKPSLFGRLTHRLADAVFVQSAQLADFWPHAEVFDPLIRLGPASEPKDDLGLVTVGTYLTFDRLVRGVAALQPDDGRPSRLVAQVGEGGDRPEGLEATDNLEFEEMLALLDRTNVVFCHGGTGSLITALRAGCRVVAMPRRPELGELYNDHQREIVTAFAGRGLIEVAEDADDLKFALGRALAKQPEQATTDYSALVERLRELITGWFAPS